MAEIKFKKLTFRNFMSYGNNLNEFTFPEGMLWFSAGNGFGKSTVVEALNFGLFGVSYRGGNKGDLRNTKNVDSDMVVIIEFDARENEKSDWKQYRLFRTMIPSGKIKFDIELMQGGKWVVQNKRTGYGQKDFEENILGFNEILFKAVVAQNTQETQPFMQLGAAKRRELTESIIAMPTDMIKKGNGKKMSEAKLEFDVQTAEYRRLGIEIENTTALIAQMKNEQKANIDGMRAEIADLTAQVAANIATAKSYEPEIGALTSEIAEKTTFISAEAGIRNTLSKLNNAVSAVNMLSGYVDEEAKSKTAFETVNSEFTAMGYAEVSAKLAEIDAEIRAIEQEITKHTREVTECANQESVFSTKMELIMQNANSLKAGVPCPTCGKLSTDEDLEPHRNELREEYKKVRKQFKDVSQKKTELQGIIVEKQNSVAEKTPKKDELAAKCNEIMTFYNSKVVPAKGSYDIACGKTRSCRSAIEAAGTPVDEISKTISECNAKLEKIDAVKSELANAQIKLSDIRGQMNGVLAPNSAMNLRIGSLNAEIARIERTGGSEALALAEKRLVDATAERETADQRIKDADDVIRLCDLISKMVSDNGMKKMIFDIFIPQFNRSVQRNLAKANLPFVITFDAAMDYTYSAGPGFAPTFEMLSQGQKRKVGFAISLAFRDFVNLVGNFKVNFLSLDEVLDISTDDDAMRDMLDLVKAMSTEIGCVSVITHRGNVVSDKFDYRLTITNDGAYSRLGKLEKL